jgi:TetR/AcrR family transcriptional regulator, tetracycline repressor protein
MGSRRPAKRTPLTRERVVDAAVELLDEVGLEELSLRGLARKLGVQVGALYWHVAGKQDLLDAIADRMMRELSLSGAPDEEWEALIAEAAHRLRRVLRSHRDGARVFVGSLGLVPNAVASAEVLLGNLRGAGFPLGPAAYAMNTVATFVIGFVLMEQSVPVEAENFLGVPDEMIGAIDPSRFPHLAEWLGAPHRSRDEEFAAQVQLIVNGLRADLQQRLTAESA